MEMISKHAPVHICTSKLTATFSRLKFSSNYDNTPIPNNVNLITILNKMNYARTMLSKIFIKIPLFPNTQKTINPIYAAMTSKYKRSADGTII